MWWEETIRGSQECGLLVEFYEEQPSACKTVCHCQLLRAILGSSRDHTPFEAMLHGQGQEVLRGWAAEGRVGSSRWQRHRGGILDEAQWDVMLKDLKDRQQKAVERVKEIRQQRKRQRLEQAAAAAEARLREQAAKAAERLAASANKKRQPVLHRVDGEGHGGMFDKTWVKGEGVLVRTKKRLGRNMDCQAGKRRSCRCSCGMDQTRRPTSATQCSTRGDGCDGRRWKAITGP